MKFARLFYFIGMMFNNRFRAFTISKNTFNGKECILFFNGCYYEEMDKEFLNELIQGAKNTLNNIEDINRAIQVTNQEITDEMHRSEPRVKAKKVVRKGSVYIVRCNHTNFFKIGCTTRKVESRVNELKITNPTIELIWYRQVKDIGHEKLIHEHIKDYKVRGEWFDVEDWAIEEVKLELERLNS